jgi:hypothetical protein
MRPGPCVRRHFQRSEQPDSYDEILALRTARDDCPEVTKMRFDPIRAPRGFSPR